MTTTAEGRQWLTNNPEAAKALRHSDRRYEEARNRARSIFSIPDKAAAIRQARARHEADYALISAGAFDRIYLDETS